MVLLMRPSGPMLAILTKDASTAMPVSDDDDGRPLQRDVYGPDLGSGQGMSALTATTAGTQLTTPAAGVIGELERLAELRGSGALTEDEFAAAKTRLLAR